LTYTTVLCAAVRIIFSAGNPAITPTISPAPNSVSAWR
jgi:hypothetical protein